jgi:hypothetical protein
LTETGKPKIVVRLEQKAIDELRRRAGEPTTGRAGGLALFVRRIIYEYLGWPLPTQFGELGTSEKRRPTGKARGWPKGRPRKPAKDR